MKSATLTHHLRSCGCSCFIQITFCLPFELVRLKVDISLYIDIFFNVTQCNSKIYTEFRAQVHSDKDGRKYPVCFHYFTKARFVVILSAHK